MSQAAPGALPPHLGGTGPHRLARVRGPPVPSRRGPRAREPRLSGAGTGYSKRSAYDPIASAMSAWAQNRWYVKLGTAPPFRYASTFDQAGSSL